MMFTVVWTPAAEQNLAALWLQASDRNTLAMVSNTIDALLRQDPQTRGEPGFDTVRELVIPPLGVDFDVQEPDRMVYVLSVWLAE